MKFISLFFISVSSVFLLDAVTAEQKDLIQLENNNALCYNDTRNPYVYFSSQTSYQAARNKENDNEVTPDGCVARQFWVLSRHGTRNPGSDVMAEMDSKIPNIRTQILKNHQQGHGGLCASDLENIKRWVFSANVTDDKFLVKEGYKELELMGQRFQERFSDLLTKPFVNESYLFQYTDSERTDASAKAFASGVFGQEDAQNVWFHPPMKPDLLLRFYKYCNKWLQEIDDNPEALVEQTLYQQTDEFKSVTQSVSKRLGFTDTLNYTVVELLYNMCSFDKAWEPEKLSPWCAIFNEEELKILEYKEDLGYYYQNGYGHQINYEQACPVVKDVYYRFRQAIDQEPSVPKGVFYFTHSGTVQKVLSRFGLFEDSVALTHLNRLSPEVQNRGWRTSLIDSFASNLALVLFDCHQDDYRVGAYVEEHLIQLPDCSDLYCRFSEFSTHYAPIADFCDFQQICAVQ